VGQIPPGLDRPTHSVVSTRFARLIFRAADGVAHRAKSLEPRLGSLAARLEAAKSHGPYLIFQALRPATSKRLGEATPPVRR
jgi:hypothetical protein